jgi:hypothetical protein
MLVFGAICKKPLFAQAGGAGGVPSGQTMTNQGSSTLGGMTSPAPLGSGSADYMKSEGPNETRNSTMTGPSATNAEIQASQLETQVQRDIVAARARGLNVANAQHEKLVGSTALSKGNRANAMRHFEQAERELRAAGFPG